MNKILLSVSIILPILSFAQENEPSYTLTPAGLLFLISAWLFIIVWNIICLSKLLKDNK